MKNRDHVNFIPIDPVKHRDITIRFRRDSYLVSFGTNQYLNVEEYLQFLREKITKHPDGFVLVEEDGELIGQIELSIREYEGREIGYVHLYYLVPRKRGKGYGQVLQHYAEDFFQRHQVSEFHLRVSPTNKQARAFYKKLGMKESGLEIDGNVIRMIGKV
ncbi:RimJ/RimL family protein N-acetyltransferase [Alkalibacillus filiformis]|uniref:RimJ/RimL family protein N-acetyltransferase n=1 Tax=Alkalibacillus filiformis TaxID=200990 RepID=A0ABU0DSZ9_9BACI|nr:GNAT family N-acetyltransferase [Alkalibacillus filiformis]MDQ0351431.1 RimJ/RimL family protein N-acetyltransferase [Alkalibacillus filiformis]